MAISTADHITSRTTHCRRVTNEMNMRNKVIRTEWMKDVARLEYRERERLQEGCYSKRARCNCLEQRRQNTHSTGMQWNCNWRDPKPFKVPIIDHTYERFEPCASAQLQNDKNALVEEMKAAQEQTVDVLAEAEKHREALERVQERLIMEKQAKQELEGLLYQIKAAVEADELSLAERIDQMTTMLRSY